MLMVERQQRVLEILRGKKTAQLEDMARELNVSASTIRRDLEWLENQGLVERIHGGAVYRGDGPPAPGSAQASMALTERMKQNVEAKRSIGRAAAELVQPQMTVLMDGGSTVIYAAQMITARPIQVVTNSLNVAGLFVDDDQVELILIGGSLYPRSGVTVGALATGAIADLHADLLLFSLAGIYGQDCYNINLAMAEVEQAMMRQAVKSVMLMDSTKFGRKSLARVCGLNEVDNIITDVNVDPSWAIHMGDQLIIAP